MTIPSPPPAPSRQDPATFPERADAFVAWLVSAVPAFNAMANQAGFNPVAIQSGLWTPQLWDASEGGVQATMSEGLSQGRFARVGNTVMVTARILPGYDTTGMTMSAVPHIRGLPFAALDQTFGGGTVRLPDNALAPGKVPIILPGAGALRIADAVSTNNSYGVGISLTEINDKAILFGATYATSGVTS